MTNPTAHPTHPELPECPRLSKLYRLQYEPVQNAWVMLYPEGMVKLNDSAAEIFRRCTGELSVQAIVAELEAQFEASGLSAQISDMLQEGCRRGWIH